MSEFTPITTQEDFDVRISERIGRINSKHNEEISGLNTQIESLTAQIETLTTENKANAEKYANSDATIAELTAKVKSYETASVKARVARECGLPFELAERLTGESEDDFRADAEALKKFIPAPVAPLATPEPAPSEGNQYENGLKSLLNSMNKE